jgi:hypothetical protein
MAASTASRNTQRRKLAFLVVPVKAATTIYQGTLVARDANGWAVPAADAANLVVLGIAKADVVNAGANGALSIEVERTAALFENSAAAAITQALVGRTCFVEDDNTVRGTGGTNSIKAGEVIEVSSEGVWVNVGTAPLA